MTHHLLGVKRDEIAKPFLPAFEVGCGPGLVELVKIGRSQFSVAEADMAGRHMVSVMRI
jgi:hypothetical protein